jgi:hypothetical protein
MKPFTIRIYLPQGDPTGIRVVDRLNWTGMAIAFPRESWDEVKALSHLKTAGDVGVYVLSGYAEGDEDLPTIYIGESDGVIGRISAHTKDEKKEFWTEGVIFLSSSRGLNKAHVQWLEQELIRKARDLGRCKLQNGNNPQPPSLTDADRADCEAFLDEVLQILPLVGIRAFETRTYRPNRALPEGDEAKSADSELVLVIPAQEDGFKKVFLGENQWHAIRIHGSRLSKIRYIAAYRTAPLSAITHWAEVDHIEPYGDSGKYKIVFKNPAQSLPTPIIFGNAPQGTMQGSRYTTFEKLMSAKTVMEL